jgi:hypothetical protein
VEHFEDIQTDTPEAASGAGTRPPDPAGRPTTMSRRRFLEATSAVAGAAAYAYLVRLPAPRLAKADLGRVKVPALSPATPPIDSSWDYFVQVERDSDLCLLDFYFYGFEIGNNTFGNPAFLATGSPSTVIVRFPPQHIGEGVYPASNLNTGPNSTSAPTYLFCDPSPIMSGLSGPTQLSFSFPNFDSDPLYGNIPLSNPMQYEDLLDWTGWQLNVPTVAQWPTPLETYSGPTGSLGLPLPVAPGPFDTFIEFPYALMLAPSLFNPNAEQSAGFNTYFSNRITPLTSDALVTDVFASSLQQPFYYQGSQSPGAGLVAVWANDLSGPELNCIAGCTYGYTVTDMTPTSHIQYGENT